ncbi:drug/metabolite transporter (DMT)-like permease [Methylopila capsulata]|uniref:Transporter n=1 Tax=Methylopila capsulata TaxID=61654 RepID=A0A9W6ISF6_9HYPH|nr:DMT family transporter [Methylopila capsulata]MBM7851413.1 drug/metabolite transporter (DMT)-like permease [Methylopila capsulata]GLK54470.1 transporter [Methylopila capsulata]
MRTGASGWFNGAVGITIFAGSLPATRVAVTAFDPVLLTAARATIAGGLALVLLALFRQPRPSRADLRSLAVVALGVVVGFPLLTAFALQRVTSAHSVVFIGLLPLATAAFGVLRGGERPCPAFWLFSGVGSALVAGFALSGGAALSPVGDGLMLGAIALCGLGYAEGARLSRRLGGWQVISWALALALPLMLALTIFAWPTSLGGIHAPAWAALAYVSLFSMLIGFVFWYRGLAQGGIAAVGQLQLLQPFLGLALAGGLLGEPVSHAMLAVTLGVVGCVAGARRFAGVAVPVPAPRPLDPLDPRGSVPPRTRRFVNRRRSVLSCISRSART